MTVLFGRAGTKFSKFGFGKIPEVGILNSQVASVEVIFVVLIVSGEWCDKLISNDYFSSKHISIDFQNESLYVSFF